ncbi:MAG: thioredoxin domain-containing protein [Alphaproteobacteria bacterium]|nr:thioredoxin domain-containing protein [Alphaproteobacteria bacterium]
MNWYPWGDEALAKARAERKMVFVSVGYSACHWCHVMEEESFQNPEIAAFMNENYISIKVDREERPDLDEQFLLITKQVTGAGGWPNSVFLTPDGAPFNGDTYQLPDTFLNSLKINVDLWQSHPAVIEAKSVKLAALLSTLLIQQAERTTLSASFFQDAAFELIDEVDPFNGGIGEAVKFPQEPLFLFLMDQAERSGDADLLEAVTGMLDGMIIGGIQDQIGGGFHRYAVDPEWHVPHFEKMLYNQALSGRLLIRAYSATGEIRYQRAANRLFDFVLRDLTAPSGGFYSALDADSVNADGDFLEGAYYTWTPEELAPLGDKAGLFAKLFQVDDNGDLDGRNVLNMAALPADLADEAGLTERAFYAQLDAMLGTMLEVRNTRLPPFRDEKIVVGWNAGMIETLAEASLRLDRPELFDAAAKAANFILDEMRDGDVLNRVFINGKAGVAAQLPDYAGFGLALMALHDFDPDATRRSTWLEAAIDMARAVQTRFGTAETGYFMTASTDGIARMIPVDDTSLQAGNAQALALFARLADRANVPDIQRAGQVLTSTLSGLAKAAPKKRAASLKAVEEFQAQQIGTVLYRSEGNVRVVIEKAQTGAFSLSFEVRAGWHVNSNTPLEEYFIPTALTVENADIQRLDYPDATIKSLGFNDEPLSLYEGQFSIGGIVSPDGNGTPPILTVEFQACSDEICLQPEKLNFTLW